jgi:hypothetical protein
MLACLKAIFFGVVEYLPEISGAVLAVLGVILGSFADKFNKNLRLRNFIASGCIVVAALGLIASTHQKRKTTQQMERLVSDVKHTLGNTDTIISKVAQLQQENKNIDDLTAAIQVAKTQKDPSRVASLQSQLAEAQKKAAELSAQLADAAKKLSPQVAPSPGPAPTPPAPTPLSPNTQQLKDQGLQTAQAIYDWIAVVSQDPRNHPAPATTQEEMQAEIKAQSDYAASINSEWNAKFDGRPVHLFYQLHANQGRSFNLTCRGGGSNPSAILGYDKGCADLIKAAATNLTDAQVRSWDNGLR